MSVKVSGQVWDSSLEGMEKLVALAYADFADHNGYNVYPAIDTVVQMTGASRRTVQRMTKSLMDQGILIPDGKGPSKRDDRRPNQWIFNTKALPVRDDTESPRDDDGASHSRERGVTVTPDPSVDPFSNSDDLKPYDLRQEPAYIALVNAVVRVCKRLDPGALAEDDVKIIDTLYSNGVKPDEIVTYYATEQKTERGTPAAWWYRHFWKGRRSQFPTPKDILETVEQARSFKEIQVEGESPAEKGEAEKAWRDVQNWLEGQPVSTLSSRTLDAVRAIGETNLRGMNQYNKTEYKQRFVAQWTRSGNENGHK